MKYLDGYDGIVGDLVLQAFSSADARRYTSLQCHIYSLV
jgi:hypothetical protein